MNKNLVVAQPTDDQTRARSHILEPSMKTTIFQSPAVCLIGVLLACTAQTASADLITYTLNTGNDAIAGYAGPYASAEVNRTDATHATITFTSLGGGGYSFLFGGQGAVGVNVNAASWTVGSFIGTNGGRGSHPARSPMAAREMKTVLASSIKPSTVLTAIRIRRI